MNHTTKLACLVSLAVAACSKQEEAPEPEQYRYRITTMHADQSDFLTDITGFDLNGSPLPMKPGNEVLIPKGVRLTDSATRLEIRRTDSCGEIRIEVRGMPAYDTKRSEDVARNSARRYDEAINWKVATTTAVPVPNGIAVYVDNLDGPATQIRIGQTVIDVPANSAVPAAAFVGACETGDQVMIGDRVVGRLADLEPGTNVLVDVAGGHCYVEADTAYGNDVATGRREVVGGTRGRHLVRVSQIDSFFNVNPETVIKRVRSLNDSSAGETLTSLDRITCPRG
jgi:hypothetical protein